MSKPRLALATVAAAAAAMALSACGSTVSISGAASSGTGSRDALGSSALSGTATATGADAASTPGLTSPNASGQANGSTEPITAAATPTDLGTVPTSSTSAPSGGLRPGAPIEVGFALVKGYDQFYKTIGVKGSFGPQEDQDKAIVADINAHGGLAGHPIEPVFASVDVTNSTPAPQQEQTVCDTFTQDHHVLVATANQRPNTLAACLNKRGVPFLVTSGENYTRHQLAAWPMVLAPSTLSMDDALRTTVARVAAQGYFTATTADLGPIVKVGYLYYDTPEQTAIAKNVFEPLLRQHGVKDIVGVAITYPNSGGDGSAAISQIQGSVLTFRSRGVTHMFILDNGGNITFNFPTAAESQGYRPRYAFNTFNAIGIERAYVAPAQLSRMVGTGWNPQFDVAEPQAPALSTAGQHCVALMTSKGFGSEYGIQRSIQLDDCDQLYALQLAANKAGAISANALLNAFRSLSALPTGVTFGSSFVGNAPFSVTKVRDFHFDSGCKCTRYASSLSPIS